MPVSPDEEFGSCIDILALILQCVLRNPLKHESQPIEACWLRARCISSCICRGKPRKSHSEHRGTSSEIQWTIPKGMR